jgi:FkbM family methyltransferase
MGDLAQELCHILPPNDEEESVNDGIDFAAGQANSHCVTPRESRFRQGGEIGVSVPGFSNRLPTGQITMTSFDSEIRAILQTRVNLTASCSDCSPIPKVADAGVVFDCEGVAVQVMHEGTRVLADAYCGEWMTDIVRLLRGHHEPQEELLFHHLVRHAHPGSLIVELGAWWAYYSNWWLGAVPGAEAVCVEPDSDHAAVGRANMALNGRSARWIDAALGGTYRPQVEFSCESTGGNVLIECLDMPSLASRLGGRPIEMLHMDMQGMELEFLRSLRRTPRMPRFLMVSTHHESISGSPSTHMDCIMELEMQGAVILAEHDVLESYSGDGLVAASFDPRDAGISLPAISRLNGVNPIWPVQEHPEVVPPSSWWRRRLHRVAAFRDRFAGRRTAA